MSHRGIFFTAIFSLAIIVIAGAYYILNDLKVAETRSAAGVRTVSALDSGGRNQVGYQGRTVTTYTGNLGGIAGANAKCGAAYSGSHMCSQGEALRSGATGFGGAGWIACDAYNIVPGPSGFENVACNTRTKSNYQANTVSDIRSCGQWTSALNGLSGPTMGSTGDISAVTCNVAQAIHCCK